ncbi:hypothetical protein [Neptuniibacter sp. QD37_11]|uniref:hypothetical protein n=1 Tax=Neptuniibacter sp. QD37_11 TaxID=3398209 RepID=UPI0039F47D3B
MQHRYLEKTSPFGPRTSFVSVKTRSTHFCESVHEFDALLWLEFNPEVLSYETQKHFEYTHNGRQRRYTADKYVTLRDLSSFYVEVKSDGAANKSDFQEKLWLLQYYFNAANEELRLETTTDIYNGDAVPNFRRLYRYLAKRLNSELMSRYRKQFGHFHTTFGELRSSLAKRGYPDHFGHQLLAHDQIKFDFMSELNGTSEVWTHDAA